MQASFERFVTIQAFATIDTNFSTRITGQLADFSSNI